MGRFKTIEPTRHQTQELLEKFRRLYELNPTSVLTQTIESLKQKYNSMLNSEMTKFIEVHWKSDWWRAAMLQYSIVELDDLFTVVSNTCKWGTQKEWSYSHKYEAIEKVQRLVYWKDHDRDRGIGDRDKDFERTAPLKKIMTEKLAVSC